MHADANCCFRDPVILPGPPSGDTSQPPGGQWAGTKFQPTNCGEKAASRGPHLPALFLAAGGKAGSPVTWKVPWKMAAWSPNG